MSLQNSVGELSHFQSTAPGFSIVRGKNSQIGLYRDVSDGLSKPLFLSSPIMVLGMARDLSGHSWATLIQYKDLDGAIKTWLMPRVLLAGDPRELVRRLLDMGLEVSNDPDAKRYLVSYLSSSHKTRYTTVLSTGWHLDSFVLPDRVVGDNKLILCQKAHETTTVGKLDGWKQDVARQAIGNSRLILSISSAFTSPLLFLMGAENGILNFVGPSSIGKSTALLLNNSVFGQSLNTWLTTDNGFEGILASSSDIGATFDDVGQVNPKIIGDCAYLIGNGTGKSRARRDGSKKPSAKFRLFCLSSGEVSLLDHMASAGIKPKAGQEVRFVDVSADAGAGKGIFEMLHGHESAKKLADSLKASSKKNMGHAGYAYIQYLVRNSSKAKMLYREVQSNFNIAAKMKRTDDGQVQRVADRFALVATAGELATIAEITGWPKGEATSAAVKCFQSWRTSWAPNGSRESSQALEQVKAFLQTHASRFYNSPDDERRILNCVGYCDNKAYLIFPGSFREEVCRGLREDTVLKALDTNGYLIRDSDGKRQYRRRIQGQRQRFYAIKIGILSDDEDG